MVNRKLQLSLLAVLLLADNGMWQGAASAGQHDTRIADLIKQMGSSKYAEREKAKRDLEAIGLPALELLRKSSKNSDLEVARRSQELLKKLEDRLAAEALLAPKRVKLKFKNTPVNVAFEELQRQCGYLIIVNGDRAALAQRRVTLETGQITFWEALGALCQAGGMREVRPDAEPGEFTEIRIVPAPMALPQQLPVPVKAKTLPVLPPPPPIPAPIGAAKMARALQIQFQLQDLRQHPANQPAAIVVRDGDPEKVPTFYYGALRIRLLPASPATGTVVAQKEKPQEAKFLLEVSAEPRLLDFSAIGTPRVDKAIDENAQHLVPVLDRGLVSDQSLDNAMVRLFDPVNTQFGASHFANQIPLRLKLGEKRAKGLKELSGTATIRAQSPTSETLITVDDVMKSVGRIARGKNGCSIEVLKIDKLGDGMLRVEVRCQSAPQTSPNKNVVAIFNAQGGVRVINSLGFRQAGGLGLPVLMDAAGKTLPLDNIPQMNTMISNGQLTQQFTMLFRGGTGIGEPAQMVLFGHRMITTQVPFRFEAVPLP